MPLAPPPPRLPPLGALDLLTRAVRLGGYAAAAAELGVSPGAIRARLRALEVRLGQSLFRAHARGVQATEAGQTLAAALEGPLSVLHRLGTAPPLDALAGFEAAVRLGGFAAAGAELGFSPGAIAAQVRAVERWQGEALFRRSPRGVAALPEALALQPALAAALLGIARALAEAGGATIRIAALPAVAQLWLTPRLPALRAAFPGVALSITALEHLPQSKRAPYDMALFLAETGGRLLATDALLPVCAPSLAPRLCKAGDLAALPRLADSTWSDDWRHWAQAARVPGLGPPSTVHSLYALAVAEAVAGEGVLIGHRALLSRHLETGLLVAPLAPAIVLPTGLRLMRLRPLPRGSLAARVAEWLARQEGNGTASPARTGDPQIHNLVL